MKGPCVGHSPLLQLLLLSPHGSPLALKMARVSNRYLPTLRRRHRVEPDDSDDGLDSSWPARRTRLPSVTQSDVDSSRPTSRLSPVHRRSPLSITPVSPGRRRAANDNGWTKPNDDVAALQAFLRPKPAIGDFYDRTTNFDVYTIRRPDTALSLIGNESSIPTLPPLTSTNTNAPDQMTESAAKDGAAKEEDAETKAAKSRLFGMKRRRRRRAKNPRTTSLPPVRNAHLLTFGKSEFDAGLDAFTADDSGILLPDTADEKFRLNLMSIGLE